MLFNIILLANLNLFSAPPHDIAMAIFAVTLEEQTVQLKIKIDKGDS